MTEAGFSSRILRRFAETVTLELGADQLNAMLGLSKLPAEWARPESFLKMDAGEAAHVYASLQFAMRSYFGRGAHGVLLRVGQRLWNHFLEDSALGGKAQAAVIRRLPFSTRRKPTLDMLARFIGPQSGDITVHTLDLDLLFVDHASPTTHEQHDPAPICFVTLGLIRESLNWATGQGYNVDEIACKAMGAGSCEFKITSGG